MNITARITNNHDAPGCRRSVDILIEPSSTGPADRRPSHRIQLEIDGPLCDVKGFLFETVSKFVDDDLGRAPKRLFNEPCRDYVPEAPYPIPQMSVGTPAADVLGRRG